MLQLLNKKNKLGNKGFSLVELIIVIAIMAVLVAILLPQYLQYVEKSKVSADNTAADTITNALKTMLSDDSYQGGNGVVLTWTGGATATVAVSGGDQANAVTFLTTALGKTFNASDAFSMPIKANANLSKTYTWTVAYTNGQPTLTTNPWH